MKYIIIAALLTSSLALHAQVYKFTSFATSQTIRDDKGNITHESTNHHANIPMVLDYNSNKLKTFGVLPLEITFYKVMETYETKDGDAIQKIGAIDKNGVKCAVVIIIYKHPLSSGGTAMIDISYPNTDLAYEVKRQR